MKVILYAHKWHYLDNYAPLAQELEKRKIDFDVLVLWPRNDSYAKYKKKYGSRLIEPYCTKWGKFFASSTNAIPRLLRPTSRAIFFLYTLKKLFQEKCYKILITSDDRAIIHGIVMSAAKRAQLKTILYPSESLNYVEDLVEDRLSVFREPTRTARAIAALAMLIHPRNTITAANGQKLHRYRPREVLELFFLDILSWNPWIRGANKKTDAVATNSAMQKYDDVLSGNAKEKIFITGFPPYDKLHFYLQNKLDIQKKINSQFGLAQKKLFLIIGTHYNVALYESHEHPLLDAELNSVLALLIETLGNDYNFVFKVHPQKPIAEQRENVDKNLRANILFVKDEYDAYELIAASDAILNFFSSTILAALATDSPIFCYYLFKKRPMLQKWLEKFRSVTYLANLTETREELSRMQDGVISKNLIRKYRQTDRDAAGKFDGKNTERFLRLLFHF